MWKKQKTKKGPDGAIETRLLALEHRFEAIERKMEGVDMEWSEWFDKFRRLYARLSKRQQREDRAQEQNSEPEGVGAGVPRITNPAALALLNRRGG